MPIAVWKNMFDIEPFNAEIDFKGNQQTNIEREKNFLWNRLMLQKKTTQNVFNVSDAACIS